MVRPRRAPTATTASRHRLDLASVTTFLETFEFQRVKAFPHTQLVMAFWLSLFCAVRTLQASFLDQARLSASTHRGIQKDTRLIPSC